MVKRILLTAILLLMCATAYAVDTIGIISITKADYGNHDRIYIAASFPSWYPYFDQSVVRIFFAKDHSIGDEYPQFDYLLLYRPMPGYSWQRTFWVVAPAKLVGEWNMRMDVEDESGIVQATTYEFQWDFGVPPVEPTTYGATLPWVAADVFDWNTSLVVTNPSSASADVSFTFYTMAGWAVKTWVATIPPHSVISFYLSNYADLTGYCGWMTISSTTKVAYEQMTVYYGDPSFAVSGGGTLE